MKVSPYKAGIVRDVNNGYRDSIEKYRTWMITNNLQAIFDADDRGEAVFAETIEKLGEELEYKYPAPPGFTYFLYASSNRSPYWPDSCQDDSDRILQFNHPIAKDTTSWDAIFELAKNKRYEHVLIGRGLFTSSRPQPDAYYEAHNYNSGEHHIAFNEEYCGKQYSYFIDVYFAPKEAKKIQGNRRRRERRAEQAQRRNSQPREPQYRIRDLLLKNLTQLHSSFVVASLGSFDHTHLDVKATIHAHHLRDDEGHRVGKTKQLSFKKLQLVKQINNLRQFCIRLKRNWRERTDLNQNQPLPGEQLEYFFPFIKNLLKSEEEEFKKFGRWLRREKRLMEKEREAAQLPLSQSLQEQTTDQTETQAEVHPSNTQSNKSSSANPDPKEQAQAIRKKLKDLGLKQVKYSGKHAEPSLGWATKFLINCGAFYTNKGHLFISYPDGELGLDPGEWEKNLLQGILDEDINQALLQAQPELQKIPY